jgi:excisionase family DNA binding protein
MVAGDKHMTSSRKLVDARSIARAVGVTAETILAWQRRGLIPAYRAGHKPVRFDLDEVKKALAGRASRRKEVRHAR